MNLPRHVSLFLILLSTAIPADAITGTIQRSEAVELLQQVEDLRHQGKYTEAKASAMKAQAIASELADPELEVESIYQLSLLYYYQQDYAQARAEMKMGLARAKVHELKSLEADFLAAEGVLEWKQGNLHLALPKLQEAMVIRESRRDLVSMASISNNIGIIYYTLKNYEDAEFYYRRALEFLGSQENERLKGSLYSNLAEILIPLERLDEAESYLILALEIQQETNEPQSLAYTYFNLGELASQRDEPREAVDYYKKALKLQTGINDKWAIALTRLKIAEELFNNGDVKASLEQMLPGYDLVQELNALSLLRDYSAHFIRIYEKLNQAGRKQFFADQHEWLVKRIRLQENPEKLNPSAVVQNQYKEVKIDELSPIETVIIVLLAVLILILILENSRLRSKISRR